MNAASLAARLKVLAWASNHWASADQHEVDAKLLIEAADELATLAADAGDSVPTQAKLQAIADAAGGVIDADAVDECAGREPAAVPPDIAEAREVLSKMTPGEWYSRKTNFYGQPDSKNYVAVHGNDFSIAKMTGSEGMSIDEVPDAGGIAYLRNHAAAWLDRLAASEAENERLKAWAADDPDNDCTPFQNPAFTRGDEHSHKIFCQLANEIMDGKEPGGTCSEPWESTRQRIAALARLRAVPEEVKGIVRAVLDGESAPAYWWEARAKDLARYIRDGANGGKQVVGIHYNPSQIHDGPP